MTTTEHAEPAPRRRRGRPGHDQSAILRAAVELFNRRGYDATSMGDLAKELGLTKPAIYHHVTSKEQLLGQALDDALDELTSVVTEASQPGVGAYQRLREVVRRSVEVLVAHQPSVTLLLRVRGNSEIELAALERRRWLDDRLADLVAEAVAEGALRDDVPPALVSRLLFGMVNSLVEWYRADGAYDQAMVADAITSIAFDGLARHEP
ncbi:TetR/AcrR family transcriptional regulator [Nonomuraea gerenzanensis]|uniref:Transcriptional regulator, TetR family n=1 Tax=Nonomuraea gerenzanensis TaxID=93944 RepID=A0A1M4EGM7_9ACTN|nr:TetR/AcrR family transcriptional regulator [Nonomuraea gerenzanensis]UBU09307.1 TetR/AcrR family transcriptional regulator [Nonomuraea gerenzanensis]SBO97713.1 Transcriptional regulator, TetR family [Nonomuraea gerenzanensis]